MRRAIAVLAIAAGCRSGGVPTQPAAPLSRASAPEPAAPGERGKAPAVRSRPFVVFQVVDAMGFAIPGATISSLSGTDRTGDTGTAAFYPTDDNISAGGDTFEIVASGYATREVEVDCDGYDPCPHRIDERVVLDPGVSIGGVVLDDTGSAVAGATVEVESARRATATHADEQGHWELGGVALGSAAVRAYDDAHYPADEPILAIDRPRTDLVVHAPRGAVVAGLVSDAAGKPVAGVIVRVGDERRDTTETDDRGRFELTGVRPGAVTIVVEDEGGGRGAPLQIVPLAPRGRADVRFALAPSSIAGTVVNQAGKPVAARFFLHGPEQATWRVDEDGRFEIGLDPGAYKLVYGHDFESMLDGLPEATVHTGDHHLALVLPDDATVTGRVVMTGAPVERFGASVMADRTPSPPPADPRARHAAGGRFHLRFIRPGSVSIAISGPDFQRRIVEHVKLAAGQTLDLGDIAVAPR